MSQATQNGTSTGLLGVGMLRTAVYLGSPGIHIWAAHHGICHHGAVTSASARLSPSNAKVILHPIHVHIMSSYILWMQKLRLSQPSTSSAAAAQPTHPLNKRLGV